MNFKSQQLCPAEVFLRILRGRWALSLIQVIGETTKLQRLEENLGGASVELTPEDLAA